jgi:hypothetical protein
MLGKSFGLEPEGPKYLFQLKTARKPPLSVEAL